MLEELRGGGKEGGVYVLRKRDVEDVEREKGRAGDLRFEDIPTVVFRAYVVTTFTPVVER